MDAGKAVATFHQVLLTLSSAVVLGVITFYDTIAKVLSPHSFLKEEVIGLVLGLLAISLTGGIYSLGKLIYLLGDNQSPLSDDTLARVGLIQLVSYLSALLLLVGAAIYAIV